MKCMECAYDLSDVEPNKKDLVVCPECGVEYSTALIDGSDPAAWERVRESKKFRRHGNALFFFTDELMTR